MKTIKYISELNEKEEEGESMTITITKETAITLAKVIETIDTFLSEDGIEIEYGIPYGDFWTSLNELRVKLRN